MSSFIFFLIFLKHLRTVRPLLNDEEYSRMERLSKEFEETIGSRLQRYLILKSWWSTNYVSDWWEEYVYLRGRGALMVNSNFYGIDALFLNNTTVQSARAATVVNLLLVFRRSVERQELQPVCLLLIIIIIYIPFKIMCSFFQIMVQGLVPLCSWQYERIFNTVRVPGLETDKIVHYQDSNHIVVMHRGRYFKVTIYYKGRILRPCEIQMYVYFFKNQSKIP